MNARHERTAILKLEFPGRSLAPRLLDSWSERFDLSLNVLRGRVTADDSRFEVEVRGEETAVEELLRESLPWNAARWNRRPTPTGVLA